MIEINNAEEYKKHFLTFLSTDEENPGKKALLKDTLSQALEVRKFEIELYWKRATYFWAFIAASFAGFFVVMSSNNIDNHKSILIVVSIIGFLFSLGWHLVNRGSKYWQKNWEIHVSMLEDDILGPLYKTLLNPERCTLSELTSEYPFSVSKINQILSLVIILIWIYLLVYSIDFALDITFLDKYSSLINILYFLSLFVFSIYQLFKHAESSNSKDIKSEMKQKKSLLISK